MRKVRDKGRKGVTGAERNWWWIIQMEQILFWRLELGWEITGRGNALWVAQEPRSAGSVIALPRPSFVFFLSHPAWAASSCLSQSPVVCSLFSHAQTSTEKNKTLQNICSLMIHSGFTSRGMMLLVSDQYHLARNILLTCKTDCPSLTPPQDSWFVWPLQSFLFKNNNGLVGYFWRGARRGRTIASACHQRLGSDKINVPSPWQLHLLMRSMKCAWKLQKKLINGAWVKFICISVDNFTPYKSTGQKHYNITNI